MTGISKTKLNRKQRRIAQKGFRKQLKNAKWTKLEKVQFPIEHKVKTFIAMYKNDIVSVQVFETFNGYAYGIRRHDEKPIYNYSTLQKIKNELIGLDCLAYQVYPKQRDEIDQANMTWLFSPNKDKEIFNLKYHLRG